MQNVVILKIFNTDSNDYPKASGGARVLQAGGGGQFPFLNNSLDSRPKFLPPEKYIQISAVIILLAVVTTPAKLHSTPLQVIFLPC